MLCGWNTWFQHMSLFSISLQPKLEIVILWQEASEACFASAMLPKTFPTCLLPDAANTSLFISHIHSFCPLHQQLRTTKYLLRFVNLDNHNFDSQVKLYYSMGTNSWKTLLSMSYALCYVGNTGIFSGHALYWVVTQKLKLNHPDLLLVFDWYSRLWLRWHFLKTGWWKFQNWCSWWEFPSPLSPAK